MIHLFIVANILIMLGYFFICFAVVPYMVITRLYTRISGSIFFATCAVTHAEHAYHALERTTYGFHDGSLSPLMTGNHVVQAISVITFVVGLYRQFALPEKRKRKAAAALESRGS